MLFFCIHEYAEENLVYKKRIKHMQPAECIYVSLRIPERSEIIVLYINKCLLSVTETVPVYCAVRTKSLNKIHVKFSFQRAVPWLQQEVAGLSPHWSSFDPR